MFRVGGTIELAGPLVTRNSFVAIAGQTAPGSGILIRGDGTYNILQINAQDAAIRYLRFRGDRGVPDTTDDVFVGSGAERVVLDHLSLSWANDELFDIWTNAAPSVSDVTISWTIFSEALEGPPPQCSSAAT